jgi:probable F420-dependent oxidoreductase
MSLPTGPWGAWATGLRIRPVDEARHAAAVIEQAGFSALWVTGGVTDPFRRIGALLDATRDVVVATGILSIWSMTPAQVADAVDGLPADHRDRFLLGLGVSHQQIVDHQEPGLYARPFTRMREYLDALDERAKPGTLTGDRVLAALGPRMLGLSASRAAGAHPYLTTSAHTVHAREVVGDAFLAPTQMVLLVADPDEARRTARRHLAPYLQQPNYVRSWVRQGFDATDATDGGSDRLIDALVAWGELDDIVATVHRHLEAGADHVCLQVLDPQASWSDHSLPLADWTRLGQALHA